MHRRENLLFYEESLDGFLRERLAMVSDIVNNINKERFLATPEEDLIQQISDELVIEPIVIDENKMVMEERETQVDMSGDRRYALVFDGQSLNVPGVRVTVTIPYSGDFTLWKLRPNPSQSVFPRAEVIPPKRDGIGYMDIVIEQPTDAPHEDIKKNFGEELKSIKFYLNAQESQINNFNRDILNTFRQAVTVRKVRIKTNEGVADILGIPLKPREGSLDISPIPMKRVRVRPLQSSEKSESRNEPGILEKDYEHILSVIRHVARTFECAPATFSIHDEEGLRNIILANLNGHYEGGATGETFRQSGKTDIRIEDRERAAFIAECKVWYGEKELAAAIDQLLGYLTWRDCKAAIVVFNKDVAKFTEILTKTPGIISSHPKFKEELNQNGAGEWRFKFCSANDELQLVTVTVFMINIYVKKSRVKVH